LGVWILRRLVHRSALVSTQRRPWPPAIAWPTLTAIAAAIVSTLAIATPAWAQTYTKWYLAEGATGLSADFVEDILIGNPSNQDARVRITWLLSLAGTEPPPPDFVGTHELTVKASSRTSVRVNALPGLSTAQVSAIVESLDGVDLVVERTMAWPSTTRRGAHNSGGVVSPATRWFLAEGATGFFSAFVLIANPDPVNTARVKATFLKPGGGTVVYSPNPADPSAEEITLAPGSRYTIWVNAEVPELADGQAFSTIVESMNGVGIIVERAMYWNTTQVFEGGHGSVGVTQSALTWLFAEGTTRAVPGLVFHTFLLLTNPTASPTRARVSFYTAPGTPPLQLEYALAPFSREDVWVNTIPALMNTDFSMKVESLPEGGGAAQPIVAERAVYWGPGDGPFPDWVDGHSTPGVTAEARKWAFAEGLEDGFPDTPGLNFDSYFLISNSSGTALTVRATFVREDGTGIVREFVVPGESRHTLGGFDFPELTNQRFAAFFESLNDVPFVAERAVYWGAGYAAGHASPGVPWAGPIATPPPVPAPTVTAIAPAAGPSTGGTTVTITGLNLTSTTTTVSIGGIPASAVAVLNATTITAVSGALATAADQLVDVEVTNAGVAMTLPQAFTYVAPKPPEVTSLSPAAGPTTGGTTVTIQGVHLGPGATTVTFGSSPATVFEATPTTLRVVAPPRVLPRENTTLAVDVRVTTSGGTVVAGGAFAYSAFTAVDTVLAFGDSITFGVTDCFFDPDQMRKICDPDAIDGGYPVRLQSLLRARYASQASGIRVDNAGLGGEWTNTGRNRLLREMEPEHDLVIILEGVNNLDEIGHGPEGVANDLRTMVQRAKAESKWVILCTLTPVRESWNVEAELVADLNGRIRTIAEEEGVVLADLHAALEGNLSAYLTPDGLHPTYAGYDRMAAALFDVIRLNFEGTPPPK
jgi:lysophospholipase L1-like esterase